MAKCEWQKYACDGDVISKDIKLLDPDWHMVPCNFMNGDQQYVIVLHDQRITVQTLQQQTPPCMSSLQYNIFIIKSYKLVKKNSKRWKLRRIAT